MSKAADGDGVAFDPRFLAFEYAFNLLLRGQRRARPRLRDHDQRRRVARPPDDHGRRQGDGRLPLLALMLGNHQTLIMQVVPVALLGFSRSVMRSASRRCCCCTRSTATGSPRRRRRCSPRSHAQQLSAVMLASPTSIRRSCSSSSRRCTCSNTRPTRTRKTSCAAWRGHGSSARCARAAPRLRRAPRRGAGHAPPGARAATAAQARRGLDRRRAAARCPARRGRPPPPLRSELNWPSTSASRSTWREPVGGAVPPARRALLLRGRPAARRVARQPRRARDAQAPLGGRPRGPRREAPAAHAAPDPHLDRLLQDVDQAAAVQVDAAAAAQAAAARPQGRPDHRLPDARRPRGGEHDAGDREDAQGPPRQDAQPRAPLARPAAAARPREDQPRLVRPPHLDAAGGRHADVAPPPRGALPRQGRAERRLRVCAPRRRHRRHHPRVPLRGHAHDRLQARARRADGSAREPGGPVEQRPACVTFTKWVRLAGGRARRSSTPTTACRRPTAFAEIWPLHLLDVADEDQRDLLLRLLSRLPQLIEHYLSSFIFPQTMLHQTVKLSANAQGSAATSSSRRASASRGRRPTCCRSSSATATTRRATTPRSCTS